MFDLKSIVRPNILKLEAYSSARDEFSGSSGIFLDANENPFGTLNRYPDPHQRALKAKLCEIKRVSVENCFIGNGSDEVIDLAFRIFCRPGIDKALSFTPSYGMYKVSAATNDVEMIEIPLTSDFQLNIEAAQPHFTNPNLKLIFICSPNNPTANLADIQHIEYILNHFNGIVFLDEAYIDFSNQKSWIYRINEYPNLIVSQTFSKAWAHAGIRVGTAFAEKKIIDLYDKVKPPYNVSLINQNAALQCLENESLFKKNVEIILHEKQKLLSELEKLPYVLSIFPSDANFVLITVKDADTIYNQLVENQIIVRNRNKVVKGGIRITIGTPEENTALISAMKKLS